MLEIVQGKVGKWPGEQAKHPDSRKLNCGELYAVFAWYVILRALRPPLHTACHTARTIEVRNAGTHIHTITCILQNSGLDIPNPCASRKGIPSIRPRERGGSVGSGCGLPASVGDPASLHNEGKKYLKRSAISVANAEIEFIWCCHDC